jgi:hypothetical protein
MTAHHDFDRQLDGFLRDGPTRLPDASFDAVRDRTDQTRQRVVIGPWRVPTVSKLVPIGLGAAAVIAVLFLGSQFIGQPSSSVGGPASEAPESAAPSEAPASAAAGSAAPSPTAASALTQHFTSTVHGISLSYPEGWTARAATEPWTEQPGVPQVLHPGFDVLQDPVHDGELFLWITSRPIGDSTPEDWLAEMMAGWECTTTEPIAVDGATGLIATEGCYELAAVTTAGRGYEIGLYTGSTGERQPDPYYDRAWFEDVLATVQLHPEDADDGAPSATP